MTLNLVLNSNNVVSGSNNTRYKYTFNHPLEILDECVMAISTVCIPYSWANITAKNNNNKATYYYPFGAGSITAFQMTFPDGFYSVVDINAYIQQQCIANGFYLIDQNGNNVFYLTLLYNPTYYAVQIVINAVPTALPSGWTQPSNWTGFPTIANYSPSIVFGAGMAKIVGYTTSPVGTSSAGNQSFLSSSTPQGSIVNSLVIRSNLVDNECGFPTDILDCMSITSSYGTNLVYSPNELKWVSCTAGTFQSFEIYFCDQNYNQIYALDNNVCISILLKNGGKPMTSIVPLTFKE